MGMLYTEEFHTAFIHASTYPVGPPKEDSTYVILGDGVVYCFS